VYVNVREREREREIHVSLLQRRMERVNVSERERERSVCEEGLSVALECSLLFRFWFCGGVDIFTFTQIF
jgi:hypothetical protein